MHLRLKRWVNTQEVVLLKHHPRVWTHVFSFSTWVGMFHCIWLLFSPCGRPPLGVNCCFLLSLVGSRPPDSWVGFPHSILFHSTGNEAELFEYFRILLQVSFRTCSKFTLFFSMCYFHFILPIIWPGFFATFCYPQVLRTIRIILQCNRIK